MRKEVALLENFIREKGLRYTPQREEILRTFLSVERHLSAEELFRVVKKKNPGIGYVSVYRTMKLLVDAGLCSAVDLGDGIARFEHKYNHRRHGHLICVKCGNCMEVRDPEVEKFQEAVAKENGFVALRHKLEIFGVCSRCSKRG